MSIAEERKTVLVIDDEEQMALAMESVLARMGHSVLKASNGKEGLEVLESGGIDLVISDMRMPVMTGEEFLAEARTTHPRLPVVMITAYGTINQAVDAMKHGAFDFVTKPFSSEDLESTVIRALTPGKKSSAGNKPAEKLSTTEASVILTNDPQFKRVLEISTAVAHSAASVFIQGESGTGKELIARLIHLSSNRSKNPFVAVNCAALPENLLESELFGHEKGAFTGAIATKVGKFELAHGGTLLLDEISEMDPLLQAKLLRVLQEREVDRVGGQKPIPVDVRVIATSNRNIAKHVQDGAFREDLYYRLNVVPLYVPPLRERDGDVKLLLEHFVRKFSGGRITTISEPVLAELEVYNWPGNIRELQNACERAVLLAGSGELKAKHFFLGSLNVSAPKTSTGDSDKQLAAGMSVAQAEKLLIFETLRETGNNKTKAAELLGISIRTLRNKLNEYDGESA